MTTYRDGLPQLDGGLFLNDAGLETDLIFNKGVEIREFAAHTLLTDPVGRAALADYLRGFLTLARDLGTGFVLDTQTWKAHPHWADDLGATEASPAPEGEPRPIGTAHIALMVGAAFCQRVEPLGTTPQNVRDRGSPCLAAHRRHARYRQIGIDSDRGVVSVTIGGGLSKWGVDTSRSLLPMRGYSCRRSS